MFIYVLYREKHMELYMFVATQRWLLGAFMSGVLSIQKLSVQGHMALLLPKQTFCHQN